MTFPLIQLPRKSEEFVNVGIHSDITWFPLIQLPRKSEADFSVENQLGGEFPLIQLPRKSEGDATVESIVEAIGFH